jgi:hypothetical protein
MEVGRTCPKLNYVSTGFFAQQIRIKALDLIQLLQQMMGWPIINLLLWYLFVSSILIILLCNRVLIINFNDYSNLISSFVLA